MTAAELLASLPEGTTPGPWRFDSHPPAMVLAAGDPGCVGTFPMNHGRFTTLRPADAALIAAAPALVDALRAVLRNGQAAELPRTGSFDRCVTRTGYRQYRPGIRSAPGGWPRARRRPPRSRPYPSPGRAGRRERMNGQYCRCPGCGMCDAAEKEFEDDYARATGKKPIDDRTSIVVWLRFEGYEILARRIELNIDRKPRRWRASR